MKQPTTRDADGFILSCIRETPAAARGAANEGVHMYYGHKQDRVGVLTDKLVDGHERLAGAWREKGCWGPGRLGPALAPGYDARDDDDRGTLRRGDDAPGLCC